MLKLERKPDRARKIITLVALSFFLLCLKHCFIGSRLLMECLCRIGKSSLDSRWTTQNYQVTLKPTEKRTVVERQRLSISLKPCNNPRNRSESSPNICTYIVFPFPSPTFLTLSSFPLKEKPVFGAFFLTLSILFDTYPAYELKSWGKNHAIESHASLFGLTFWTFNLGDNRPILEPVFGVEGRSTTVLTLR